MKMAHILLIDDENSSGNNIAEFLVENDHSVVWVPADRVSTCQDECRALLTEQEFDIVVLDIQLGAEVFAGIWVYCHLIKSELRNRWTHTIVYTKHGASNIQGANSQSMVFPIKVFVNTAGIPNESVLNSKTGGRKPLLDRIHELMSVQSNQTCNHCGQILST